MELIYLIDRIITRMNHILWFRIMKYSPFDTDWTIYFLSAIPYLYIGSITDDKYLTGGFWTESPLIISWMFISKAIFLETMSKVLRIIHLKLDPERALIEDRQYQEGYKAWGSISLGLFAFVIYISEPWYMANWIFFYSALYLGNYELYRRRRYTNNRKRKTSEALVKLLEKCRTWIPKPVPSPSS